MTAPDTAAREPLPANLDELATGVAAAARLVQERSLELDEAANRMRAARGALVRAEAELANARQALDKALAPVTPSGGAR